MKKVLMLVMVSLMLLTAIGGCFVPWDRGGHDRGRGHERDGGHDRGRGPDRDGPRR